MFATNATRKFVPADMNPANVDEVEALYRQLLARPIDSVPELEQWLRNASELAAVESEYSSRLYIDKSCHTDDPEIERRYLHFVENVDPKLKPLSFEFQKKFLQSPHRRELPRQRFAILDLQWQADVDLYRDENVPLETQLTKLSSDYDKICGEMMVNYRGRDNTLQQMERFLEETDRATREEAWKLVQQRRLRDVEPIESIFDHQLELRHKVAMNAGLSDYRAYAWKMYKRFDYTPDDCLRFADAIEATVVPLVKELNWQRREELKVETLRPWDLSVDPKNRPPLRPFDESDVTRLLDGTQSIFNRLSPALGEQIGQMRRNNNLDLASRKGKQPGGYQTSLEESRQPFIFMNAAGLQQDIETMLHEGGHAFHYFASAGAEELVFLRHAPIEFCEVASMSMELLGGEHFDVFYSNPDEQARAKRALLEGVLALFPWVATIDTFQHWLYTNPDHTREQRGRQWIAIHERFSSGVDWGGFENMRWSLWQKQLHLFHLPFYYVEYAIAQLGALQLWMKARQDPRQALSNYRAALKLGGTRPLPELFATAGIAFDFSEKTLRPLMSAVAEELESLPR